MMTKTFTRTALGAALVAMTLGSLAMPAQAQRDPAYAQARANQQVGEKVDGYLGIVGEGTPELRAMVNDINIRRRALYAERAQGENATLEEYAFAAGCLAIARTEPGEIYQAPDGSWQVRTTAPPRRDPRCP